MSVMEVSSQSQFCPVCPDECGVQTEVEPEVDGEHQYWECSVCGYAWGYSRVADSLRIEGACGIGVPEAVRKAASFPAEAAQRKLEEIPTPVLLGMPSFPK